MNRLRPFCSRRTSAALRVVGFRGDRERGRGRRSAAASARAEPLPAAGARAAARGHVAARARVGARASGPLRLAWALGLHRASRLRLGEQLDELLLGARVPSDQHGADRPDGLVEALDAPFELIIGEVGDLHPPRRGRQRPAAARRRSWRCAGGVGGAAGGGAASGGPTRPAAPRAPPRSRPALPRQAPARLASQRRAPARPDVAAGSGAAPEPRGPVAPRPRRARLLQLDQRFESVLDPEEDGGEVGQSTRSPRSPRPRSCASSRRRRAAVGRELLPGAVGLGVAEPDGADKVGQPRGGRGVRDLLAPAPARARRLCAGRVRGCAGRARAARARAGPARRGSRLRRRSRSSATARFSARALTAPEYAVGVQLGDRAGTPSGPPRPPPSKRLRAPSRYGLPVRRERTSESRLGDPLHEPALVAAANQPRTRGVGHRMAGQLGLPDPRLREQVTAVRLGRVGRCRCTAARRRPRRAA